MEMLKVIILRIEIVIINQMLNIFGKWALTLRVMMVKNILFIIFSLLLKIN